MERTGPDVLRLIRVPALIALAVTLLRLTGELAGGPEALFGRAAGGGGSLVGIVWLVPLFGAYFAVKLVREGHGPASPGRVVALVVSGLAAGLAIVAAAVALTGNPNVPGAVSVAGAFTQQLGFTLATVVALALVWRAWPAFFRTMFAYALASRIPVAIVMLVAMIAGWGTHYELGPPGYPEMSVPILWVATGLFPQMTTWVAFTVLVGGLVGGIAAGLARSTPAAREAERTA